MDDTISNDSLYNFLIKDCGRPQTLLRCENQTAKKPRRCSCRAVIKTDAQAVAAAAAAVTKRRQQNEKRSCGGGGGGGGGGIDCGGGSGGGGGGGGCCEYSRNRCADRGLKCHSYLDAVGRLTRNAIDWAWCRKSHLLVALVSFVLGMCVEDLCQCM